MNDPTLVKPSLSLYDREQEWKQLEELLASDAEQVAGDQELVALVEKQFLALQDKRDSFCAFLAWLEGQQAIGEVEIKRLTERVKRIAAAQKRLEGLAVNTIRSLGQDDKGKWKKLEGRTSTLQLNRNPASVEVTDEALVPLEFKTCTVTVTVPAKQQSHVIGLLTAGGYTLAKDAEIKVAAKPLAEALKQMIPCATCGQLGVIQRDENGPCLCMVPPVADGLPGEKRHVESCPQSIIVCSDCSGAKQLPRKVPGAQLVTDKVRLVRK